MPVLRGVTLKDTFSHAELGCTRIRQKTTLHYSDRVKAHKTGGTGLQHCRRRGG